MMTTAMQLTLKTFRNLSIEQIKCRTCIVHARVAAELAQNGANIVTLTVNEAEKRFQKAFEL